MSTWYYVDLYSPKPKIVSREATKETDASLFWDNGRRELKLTEYRRWFSTPEAAIDDHRARIEAKLNNAREEMSRREKELSELDRAYPRAEAAGKG